MERRSLADGLRSSTVACATALLALMLAGVAWVRGWILFTWPLWLDEFHTLLLAERGSFVRSMSDLAAGADFNPPLLYVIERLVAAVSGGLTPITLRVTAFITVWLALVFIFVALRRQLPSSAAFLGAFAVWSHYLVVDNAFQGRFYGPWLLFAAMVLWSLDWDSHSDVSKRRDAVLGLSSVFVCTIHWFGIISLGLIAIGASFWVHRTGKSYRRLIPMVAGPVALAACIPFYLGQRTALTVKSWVPPLTAHQIREMIESYFIAGSVVIGIILNVVWVVRNRVRHSRSVTRMGALPFVSLLLMPLVIVLFSLLVQPAMMPRYAIVASLAWAPIVAFGARPLPPTGKLALLTVLFFFSVKSLGARARGVDDFRMTTDQEARVVTPLLDSGVVVMVPSRQSLYPLAATTSRDSQLVYPDFTDSVAEARKFSQAMIVERDVARIHQQRYGFPRMMSIDHRLWTSDLHVFLPIRESSYTLSLLFPDDAVNEVAPHIFLLHPRDKPAPGFVGDTIDQAKKLLYIDHNPARAVDLLDGLLLRDPHHYEALWERAAALEAAGQKEFAILAWRDAVSEAEQRGYTDRLEEARERLIRLSCGDSSSRKARRLSLLASVLERYRCVRAGH